MVNSQNSNPHTDPTSNPSSVYFLHPSDSNQKLVNIVFSGRGFANWKRVMTIALLGKNKLGFVDGSLPRPTSNSGAKAWDRVDNVVMGWIIAVLEDSIANSILSYKTSKEIWDELRERYGQSSNAQMFSLQEELNALLTKLGMVYPHSSLRGDVKNSYTQKDVQESTTYKKNR